MLKQLHKAFSHIVFFEDGHKYIDTRTGEQLVSVTTHIQQFQPKFNKDFWLPKKAAERGITPEELDKEWRWKSKVAVEQGSALHSFLEQGIQRRIINPYKNLPDYIDRNIFAKLIQHAEAYLETVDKPVVACEFVMTNKTGTLAGMCDLLLEGENGLILIDYKTGQLKDSYGKYHSGPYQTLEASSLGKYTLQLNHYRSFLEDAGFPVEEMKIVWFNENNDSFEIYLIDRVDII